MISMIFNMGVGNFRTSEFIQYVKRNQMDKAEEQIKKESSRSFRKFPGLKDRREREANMFGGEPLNESKNRNTDAAKFLFRRVTKEELDNKFNQNYKYYSDNWNRLIRSKDKTFNEFKKVILTMTMDLIHGKLIDGFLDTNNKTVADFVRTSELYNNILEIIDEMYGDRIAKLWTQKTGKRV